MAYQMAAACIPFKVDQCLIYHGGLTALAPIELYKYGIIFSDIEMKWNKMLEISELKCIKKMPVPTNNLVSNLKPWNTRVSPNTK